MKMSRRKYSDDQFREAVQKARNIREALGFLGLKPAGGNYKTFKHFCTLLSVDTTHFVDGVRDGTRGRKFPERHIPSELHLVAGSIIQSFRLKKYLFREGLFAKQCNRCKLTEWLGKPIPLELDHINGVSNDNRLENLRILCPNCHSLTPTYRGKNKGKLVP